jgi:polar amino acid transport system substrate-binding protein
MRFMTFDVARDLAPSGALRASINLGNPVLAQGSAANPAGVTVDLAREIGRRLGLPVELLCFGAARESVQAMAEGRADLCFLAVDPAREHTVAFTAPYAVIEGVYAVRADSAFVTSADVDQPGVRIGVKRGSAYDLFLTRTLTAAEVVRGEEGPTTFEEGGLEVVAGIRQPVQDLVDTRGGLRVLEPRFMQIQQAVGTARHRRAETVAHLADSVEELKANGFVAESLRRSGRTDATVAPPATLR